MWGFHFPVTDVMHMGICFQTVVCLKKKLSVPKLKSIWRVKIDGNQLRDSGSVNFDEMVDIKQSGQEVDIQSDKLTSLKPLHITSLSFPEGSIDLVNYGGACLSNPSSCINASVSALGGFRVCYSFKNFSC